MFFTGQGISDNRFIQFELSQPREVPGYQLGENAVRELIPGKLGL